VRGLRLSPCNGGIPVERHIEGAFHRIARRDRRADSFTVSPETRIVILLVGWGSNGRRRLRAASGRPLSFTP
jgi:hypothetical protein